MPSKSHGSNQSNSESRCPKAFEQEGLESGGACADDYKGVDYTHPVNDNAPRLDMGTPPGGRKRYNAPEGD